MSFGSRLFFVCERPTRPTVCEEGLAHTHPSLLPNKPQPHSFLPHVGRVTIIMNDYPLVKYALIGVLGLFVVTSKE